MLVAVPFLPYFKAATTLAVCHSFFYGSGFDLLLRAWFLAVIAIFPNINVSAMQVRTRSNSPRIKQLTGIPQILREALFRDVGGALPAIASALSYATAVQLQVDCALLAHKLTTRDCMVSILSVVFRPVASVAVSTFKGLGLRLNRRVI